MCLGRPIGAGLTVCYKCKKMYCRSASEEEIKSFDLCTCDGDKYRFVRTDRWEKVEQ